MGIRVAINGFGRIGRMVLRAIVERGLLGKAVEVVAISDINDDPQYLAYQFKYDSVRGRAAGDIKADRDSIVIGGNGIRCLPVGLQHKLLWGDLGVDLVIESSGAFLSADKASIHLHNGAEKVLITAPAQGDVKTIVMGVNEHEYDDEYHRILSASSCTINCLAMPVWVLLKEHIGIENGHVTAINSYTASQRIVDGASLRGGWRTGRAAGANIIPSPSSAQKLTWEVLPKLAGKLSGLSYRVPTIDGSLVDFVFRAQRDSSFEEIEHLLKQASQTYLKGYLDYTDEELVSSDIIGTPCSAIYDRAASAQSNLKGEKRSFRLVCWYDNEWGYANRVIDLMCFCRCVSMV